MGERIRIRMRGGMNDLIRVCNEFRNKHGTEIIMIAINVISHNVT